MRVSLTTYTAGQQPNGRRNYRKQAHHQDGNIYHISILDWAQTTIYYPYPFVQFEAQRYCLQLSSTAENLFHIV
jgi:hypothetical protein